MFRGPLKLYVRMDNVRLFGFGLACAWRHALHSFHTYLEFPSTKKRMSGTNTKHAADCVHLLCNLQLHLATSYHQPVSRTLSGSHGDAKTAHRVVIGPFPVHIAAAPVPEEFAAYRSLIRFALPETTTSADNTCPRRSSVEDPDN